MRINVASDNTVAHDPNGTYDFALHWVYAQFMYVESIKEQKKILCCWWWCIVTHKNP